MLKKHFKFLLKFGHPVTFSWICWLFWFYNIIIQWWFVNPGSDSPEISLIRTKSAGTDFLFWTDRRFSNPENLFIRKYRPGTNVSGLTNHHCIFKGLIDLQSFTEDSTTRSSFKVACTSCPIPKTILWMIIPYFLYKNKTNPISSNSHH